MPDENSIPAPPPGFSPVQSAGDSTPPPPPGFKPVQSDSVMGNPNFDLTTPRDAGGAGPAGVAIGAGKGVLQTVAGAGELIHKIPAVGPVLIPETGLAAEEKAAEPQGFAENLGSMLESGLEFASGEEVLNAVTRVAKVEQLMKGSTTVANMFTKHPRLIKAVARIAKQTAVGGAQGAVKGAAEGDAVGGAEGGAAGAAVGSTVAEAGGAAIPAVAKKIGLMTDDVEDIMRAAKPGKRNEKFLSDWDTAKGEYAKELDANGSYADYNDAAERMRDLRQNFWKDKVAPKIALHANEQVFPTNVGNAPKPGQAQMVFSNPISDSIRSKITPAMKRLDPKSEKTIETIAKRFDGTRTVKELEDDIEHLNAKLSLKDGYYSMNASERAAALKADPSIAATVAAVEASRDQLTTYLEKAGEKDIPQLKKTYGAMRNVENEVRGQVNVAGRQNPISLKQMIAVASGHPLGIAATMADKIYNDPASILERAVRKNIPDGPVASAAKDVVSGTATVTKKAIPAAGAGIGRMVFIGGDGKKYLGDPAKWDQIQQADPAAKQVSQ